MGNHSHQLRTEIQGYFDLVANHILLAEAERHQLDELSRFYHGLGTDDVEGLRSVRKQLSELKEELKLREVGEASKRTIRAYGTDLIDDEAKLKASIAKEKRGQYVVVTLVSILILLFSLYLMRLSDYLISQTEVSLRVMIVQITVIFSFASILYFLFRIFQNAREAAERMDEKTIGITFLIYGLKFMATNPTNDSILKIAAQMFLGHQGLSSKAISDREFRDFVTPFTVGIPKVATKNDNAAGGCNNPS